MKRKSFLVRDRGIGGGGEGGIYFNTPAGNFVFKSYSEKGTFTVVLGVYRGSVINENVLKTRPEMVTDCKRADAAHIVWR